MTEIGRTLSYVYPYWRRLAIGLIGLIGSSVITLALPYAINQLVDSVFLNQDFSQLNTIGILLTALFIVQGFVSFAYRYFLQYVAQRAVADLRLELHRHMLTLPLRFFSNNRVGELISRMSNDATVVQGIMVDAPVALIRQVITVIGGIVLMLMTNWQLSLIILVMIPPFVFLATFYGKRLKTLATDVQDRLADATVTLEELLSGIRVVKSFAQEDFEEKRYSTEIEQTFSVSADREFLRAIFVAIFSGLGFAAMTFLIWFGGRQVISGIITPGELIGFLFYFIIVSSPLTEFANIWGKLQEGLGAIRRIFEIMDTAAEPGLVSGTARSNGNNRSPIVNEQLNGHVRFVNVSFQYDSGDALTDRDTPAEDESNKELLTHDDKESPVSRPVVLQQIDLEAEPGKVIALVGYSGSGKTTLLNLIPRFYDPTEGRIEIDGVDIRTMPVRQLRAQIGLVPQETFLFGGTIRENIAYGRLDATDEEIAAAAEAAYAQEFIKDLPSGFSTVVGERGVKLSAGQRQRIAIARAILKDPRILLLDEATSALDTESERWVQAALERLMEGRTSFVIAHRLSTIQRADVILAMEKGKIVERGSHSELLKKGGLYQHLHDLQFENTLTLPQPD